MPIDPNIALGVKPIEQPNMLGQMAQVMALRQAQQEMEGSAGVNELSRRGEKDPYAYIQYGKQGRETAASITKIQKEKLESDDRRNVMLGGLAGPVMENPTPTTFNFALDRAVNYGLMTPTQKQEVLAQYGGNPESIKGYVSQIYKGSINAQAQQANATSIANNAATVGASMFGHRVTQQKNEYEQQYPTMNQVVTAQGIGVTPSRGPNAGRITPVFEPSAVPPPTPPAASTTFGGGGGGLLGSGTYGVPNAFVQGAPSNMLRADAQAPVVTGAEPVRAQPKPVVRQPVAVMKNGKAVMVSPEEAVGMQPASADAEKAARLQAIKVQDLTRTIKNLEEVTKEGGLISQSTGSGFGRMLDTSAAFVGQANPGAIATAKLAPIADMVLKMVPRFEGPQSDKDTQSYKEAAGQLANSALPNETRQAAGREILRLMKEYKDQFVSSAMDAEGISPANTPARTGDIADSAEIKAAMDWANSNPKDPRAAKIKQHFGAK